MVLNPLINVPIKQILIINQVFFRLRIRAGQTCWNKIYNLLYRSLNFCEVLKACNIVLHFWGEINGIKTELLQKGTGDLSFSPVPLYWDSKCYTGNSVCISIQAYWNFLKSCICEKCFGFFSLHLFFVLLGRLWGKMYGQLAK